MWQDSALYYPICLQFIKTPTIWLTVWISTQYCWLEKSACVIQIDYTYFWQYSIISSLLTFSVASCDKTEGWFFHWIVEREDHTSWCTNLQLTSSRKKPHSWDIFSGGKHLGNSLLWVSSVPPYLGEHVKYARAQPIFIWTVFQGWVCREQSWRVRGERASSLSKRWAPHSSVFSQTHWVCVNAFTLSLWDAGGGRWHKHEAHVACSAIMKFFVSDLVVLSLRAAATEQ